MGNWKAISNMVWDLPNRNRPENQIPIKRVSIEKFGTDWEIMISSKNKEIRKDFKTKEQAVAYAKNYMKNSQSPIEQVEAKLKRMAGF